MYLEKKLNRNSYIKSNRVESVIDSMILDYIKQNIKKETDALKNFIGFFERKIIHTALSITNGNQKIAAEIIGVSKTTLNEKLKRLDICQNDYKSNILNIVENRLDSIRNQKMF